MEEFKSRVAEMVDIEAKGERTNQIIEAKVTDLASKIVNNIAEMGIREAIAIEIKKIESLNIEDVLKSAAIPSGAILAFNTEQSCPMGWAAFEEAAGRFIVGAGPSKNLDANRLTLSTYTVGALGERRSMADRKRVARAFSWAQRTNSQGGFGGTIGIREGGWFANRILILPRADAPGTGVAR